MKVSEKSHPRDPRPSDLLLEHPTLCLPGRPAYTLYTHDTHTYDSYVYTHVHT